VSVLPEIIQTYLLLYHSPVYLPVIFLFFKVNSELKLSSALKLKSIVLNLFAQSKVETKLKSTSPELA
jgi:hypothetical protein